MKLFKKSRKKRFSEENLRSFVDFMNGGSEEAEQFKQKIQRIVDGTKRDIIEEYKLSKFMYEDLFGGDIDDDEDFDDIQF